MAKLLASSQITIVDLNDAVSLRSYIGCTHARIQFLSNNGTYTPNFAQASDNVILTAEMNKMGDNINLIKNPGTVVTRVDWFVKIAPSQEYTKITPSMIDTYELMGVSPWFSGLKIKQNIMDASHPGVTFKVEIDYKESWMTNVHTQISEIDFNLTIQGNDGTDAYTAILTNSTHTIICNPDGSADTGELGKNGRAFSDTIAYKGTEILQAVASNPTTGQYSIELENVNCTAIKLDDDTFYINSIDTATASIDPSGILKTGNLASVRSLTNGGKVKVKFNLEGSTTIVQEMTFSKVFNGLDGQDGNDGRDGESAKYITLNIKEGTSTFKYNKNSTTPTISRTVLQAIGFNITSPKYKWYYFANNTWTLINGQTEAELTVNATDSYFESNNSVAFRCIVNNLYKDEITISKLIDGSDSFVVNLSNESHVIACYNGGGFKPGEADRATTDIIAYKGANTLNLITTGTPNTGQYKIDIVANSDVTFSILEKTLKITNMTADSAVLVINVNCEGTIIKKTMSLSKAKDGREGVDGYVAALTNEFHSLPARADGTVTSFNGCNTSIQLFKGSNLITTDITYSATANNGVIGSLTGNTYTVTGLSVDSSSVNLTATYNGKNYSKTFTITKNKQGSDGSDSTSYWLIPSTTAINKNKQGVLSPTTVVYTAKSQTGNQPLTNFSGRFKIYKSLDRGASFGSPVYTSSSDEASKQFPIPSDATAIKCELYLPNGTTLVDTQTIIVTSDGLDGQNGQDAAYVKIAGEGIFKYGPNFIGIPIPSTIVLTRSLYNASGGKWQYHNGTNWTDFSPAETGGTLEITPTMAHFATSSNKTMRIRYFISNSIYDETSIVKVADGVDGTNAFTVMLDNESHTVAADKDGELLPGELTKAKTGITVYKGTEIVTNFTISKISDDGIMTDIDNVNKAIMLKSMLSSSMSGLCTVSIIVEGQSIQKIFSITKSKQGADGSNAKLLVLTATSQTFKYKATDDINVATPVPATITLTADCQNLSNSTKAWKYKPNTASNWTALTGMTNNNTTYSVSPTNTTLFPNGAVACQFMCESDGMTDYITISKIQDGKAGTDAFTVVLSNPSHTVPADSNGQVSDTNLATCTTDVIVYKGSSIIQPTMRNLVSVPNDIFSIVQATSNANAKIVMKSFPTNVDTATATVDVQAGNQILKQTFTVTKAKQGIQGNSAKFVYVTGSQVFKYAKNNTVPSPATITISAVENNFTGSNRKWYANGQVISGQTSTNLVINPTSLVSGQYFMNSDSVTFKYESDGKTDEITIAKMYDGTDTYSVILTNESHAISCDKDGNPLNGELNKAATKVRVFRGSTELTASNSLGLNTFKITAQNVVGGTSEYVTENSINVGVKVKTITADSGSIPISINIENGKAIIEKVFTFNKLKVGATGASAKVIQITGASSIIYKNNGTYDPSTGIPLTVQKKNTTDNVVWKVNGTQVATGNTYTVLTSAFTNIKNYIIRAELANDSNVYDTHSISKVSDGIDSIISYIWCPNGSTIKNENAKSLKVEGVIFSGSTNVSTNAKATYFWEKKVGSNWEAIKGTASKPIAGNADGNSVVVTRDDIPYMLIVKCTMTYGSVTQTDTIVLEDISDPIHSRIHSTAGETFKNGQGETYLIAHILRNGEDLDSITVLDTKPLAAGSQGEIIYVKADKRYYKFNDDTWNVIDTPHAGDNSTYTYTWSKADANGNISSDWSKSGKVIHVTANEIYQKAIFMVDVEGQ